MPEVGFEPTRPFGQSILNRSRLPFRHSGRPAKGSRAQERVKTATIVPTAVAQMTPKTTHSDQLSRSNRAL
jgi:hypothetical protein